jgi:Sec-independent protein translocase protein TatA
VGIDIPELLILAVLALILFGPEKLPEYAAKLGQLVAKMRMASSEVTKPLQQALHPGAPQSLCTTTPLLTAHFCHQCGHTREPGFVFCPRCGLRLEKDQAGPGTFGQEKSSQDLAS